MDYFANFLIKAGKFKLEMNLNVLVVAKEIENSKKKQLTQNYFLANAWI